MTAVAIVRAKNRLAQSDKVLADLFLSVIIEFDGVIVRIQLGDGSFAERIVAAALTELSPVDDTLHYC